MTCVGGQPLLTSPRRGGTDFVCRRRAADLRRGGAEFRAVFRATDFGFEKSVLPVFGSRRAPTSHDRLAQPRLCEAVAMPQERSGLESMTDLSRPKSQPHRSSIKTITTPSAAMAVHKEDCMRDRVFSYVSRSMRTLFLD